MCCTIINLIAGCEAERAPHEFVCSVCSCGLYVVVVLHNRLHLRVRPVIGSLGE